MAPVDDQPGYYSVIVHLPPGYHQYKFIVDGEWRHDETQPFMPDPLGNVNNWLFVRKPEGAAPSQQTGTAPSSRTSSPAPPLQPAMSDMAVDTAPSSVPSIPGGDASPIALDPSEPAHSRKKLKDFLISHTAYELIPESGKVVVLDLDLPVRQAFHALHDQGMASAPLWDSEAGTVCGMVSASDFILSLQRLRSLVLGGSAGLNNTTYSSPNNNTTNNSSSIIPLSEREMDYFTVRAFREELSSEGLPPKELAYVVPGDSLVTVIGTLIERHCSAVPIMSSLNTTSQPSDGQRAIKDASDVLHIVNLSAVIACFMRHFRGTPTALPLLGQPVSSLPLGTWTPESSVASMGPVTVENEKYERKISALKVVKHSSPLTEALQLLLETGVSSLPVVDDSGVPIDIWSRADITLLARSSVYQRLQFEDVTVGQALSLASLPTPPPQLLGGGLWGQQATASSSAGSVQDILHAAQAPKQRLFVMTARDSLKGVLERLSIQGVRRLLMVDPETKKLEGIVSLSDVAAYLLMLCDSTKSGSGGDGRAGKVQRTG